MFFRPPILVVSLVCLLGFGSPGYLYAAEADPAHEYTLVWSDEFDQPDGSAPNPDNWVYDIGGGGWGNQEEQYYTNSTDNARIEGGQLVIELRPDSGNQYPGNDYTSARLKTKDRQEFTHGRVEARIRLPFGNASGLWPAFWMLGSNIDQVGWPNCGEIDIMEYISRQPDEVFGTIHGPGYSGGAAFGSIYEFGGPVAPPEPPALSDPRDPQYYYVYAVEWESRQIRWYIDDILYHEATPGDISPNSWVFNHDYFILLNLAIGGTFGGAIDASNLTFPTQMLVDYVRVYAENVNPDLVLTKTGVVDDSNNNGVADTGEQIYYTYTLENTGFATLTNIDVTDPDIPLSVNYPGPSNLLENGDFDTGTTAGWTTSGPLSTAYAQSGTHSLQVSASGGFSSPGGFQEVSASPGDEFNLSGYMYAPNPLPDDTTFGVFKIVFVDSSGSDLVPASVSVGQLNTEFPGAESLPVLNAASQSGNWLFSEAQAVAPPGTVSAIFFALNVDQSPSTMYFDSLEAIRLNAGDSLNLEPGESDNTTFSGTYTITQSDIVDGWVYGTASASSDQISGISADSRVYLPINVTANTDGDQFVDLLERAYGLDIFSPDDASMGAQFTIADSSGNHHLQLRYRRRAGGAGSTGIDYVADGIQYRVEVSSDLENWHAGDLQVEQIGSAVDNGDGTESVTVRAIAPVDESNRFIRLIVNENP